MQLVDASKAIAAALGALVDSAKQEAYKARGTGQLSELAEVRFVIFVSVCIVDLCCYWC